MDSTKFLYGIVYYSPDDYKVFEDKNVMWNEITDIKNKGKYAIAHNCEYDLGAFIGNVIKDLENVIYRGRFIFGQFCVKEYQNKTYKRQDTNEFKKYKSYVSFMDSFNIFYKSLESIGESLKFKKIKTPESLMFKWLNFKGNPDKYYKEYKNNFKLTPQLIKYCLRDCEILYMAINQYKQFLYDNFNACLKITSSSNALNIFRINDLDRTWGNIPFTTNLFFNKAYYGGRVELFYWGTIDDKLNYYDVNSLYPSVMRNKLPIPDKIRKIPEYEDYFKYIDDKSVEGSIYCKIKTNDSHIPYLPIRDGKLLFPNGELVGYWNFPEIRFAIDHGYEIQEIYEGYVSFNNESLFKSYVEKLYKLRLKYEKLGNDFYSKEICKRLMNALYGRFGLKIENREYMSYLQYQEMLKFLMDNNMDYKHLEFTPLGFKELKAETFGYMRNIKTAFNYSKTSYLPLPSYITSYARIELLKFLLKHPLKVVYCDTDSLVLINKKMNTSKELGELKSEGSFNEGTFYGCKYYNLKSDNENITKIKGVNKHVVDINKTYFQYESTYKSKESLRRNLNIGLNKIMTKNINPLAFDKREYNNTIDYTINHTRTYPFKRKDKKV